MKKRLQIKNHLVMTTIVAFEGKANLECSRRSKIDERKLKISSVSEAALSNNSSPIEFFNLFVTSGTNATVCKISVNKQQ